jgi:hypothetical protein
MTVIWSIAEGAGSEPRRKKDAWLGALFEYVFWLFATPGPSSLCSASSSTTTAAQVYSNQTDSRSTAGGRSSP